MRYAITRLTALSGLLCLSLAAHSQQTSPAPSSETSVKKDCAALKGRSKAECEKVAVKMDQSAAAGSMPVDNPKAVDSPKESDPQFVHHSSPAMVTKEEKVVADAAKKGQDPAKALEKVKAKDAKIATQKNRADAAEDR